MADTDDQQKEGRKHFTVELERIGVAAAKVLVWAILSGTLVLYFWTKYSHRVGIASPAAYEYAQIARNNLRGEWFRTDVIRPLELWLDADVRNQPDLVHHHGHAPERLAALVGHLALETSGGPGRGGAGRQERDRQERRDSSSHAVLLPSSPTRRVQFNTRRCVGSRRARGSCP